MLIPNLKTKFKKSVPLKSYSKKKEKKVGLELPHIVRGQKLSKSIPVHDFLVSCRFSRGQKIVNFENCKT